MRLHLTDNNVGRPVAERSFDRKEVEPLFPLAGKKIAQLCRENEHLLVFPYAIEDSDDRIGDSSVLSIQNTADPERVIIATGNIMGFIGVGDFQIKIQSRFDDGRDDFLLHYMLQKVLSFNLFDLRHDNERVDVFDFLLFMFPSFLKRAMRQGVCRAYRRYERDDANIKGSINVARHIARNIPFAGKISYTALEYSLDNSMTELIRHTIEFMKTKKHGRAVLHVDQETVDDVRTIVEHTPSYDRGKRSVVISRNLRGKIHPFYTAYQPLRTLCLQILRMEEVKYGESEDEVCGILFDGAWLWEEYVNTVLRSLGFKHPENRKRKGGIYLFEGRKGLRYPDFYKEGVMVLDAKYKRLESYDSVARVDPADVNQLIAYMGRLRAGKGGFVAPLKQRRMLPPTETVANRGGTLSIFGIEISKAGAYDAFCEEMAVAEAKFVESLQMKLPEMA